MSAPLFAPFQQIAYCVRDLDAAMETFERNFGISQFFQMEVEIEAELDGKQGKIATKTALANTEGVQIELSQDNGTTSDFWSWALPPSGDALFAFHHIATMVHGDRQLWEAHLKKFAGHPVACSFDGQPPGDNGACFLDHRKTLGHLVELTWMGPETAAIYKDMVPFNPVTFG